MRDSSGRARLRGFLSSRAGLPLFFVCALLGTFLLALFLLGRGYGEAGRQAENDARNVAGVLEARLSAGLRRLHADLEQLAAQLPPEALQPEHAAEHRAAIAAVLRLHGARFPELVGYRVISADGTILYGEEGETVSGDVRDRDYYRSLVADPGRGLVFSEVVSGRLSGRGVLVAALAVRDGEGRLAGVIAASLDLDYLRSMFEAVNLGPQAVITFRRSDDGRLVLRRPARPDAVNRVLTANPLHQRIESGDAEGSIRYRAALDGVERIYAYRRVGDYPFYVAVGIAGDDYLAGWRHTAWLGAATALLLALALGWLLVRLLRTQREEAAIGRRLAESEARYRMLAENSHDVIWTLDIPSRRFTYVSPSVVDLRGYTWQEALGQTLAETLTEESAARVERDIVQRLQRMSAGERRTQVVTSELDQRCKDGSVVSTEVVSSYLLDADGVPRTILGITRNVSERKAAEQLLRDSNRQMQTQLEEIQRLQAALREQAVRDPLTGLYNRRYLDETLEREISRARRDGLPLSVVMLDIDHFKRINDTHGHQLGDEVLRLLGRTLLGDIRLEDVACRYGGEEFLILLPAMPLEAAVARAEGWRRAVASLALARDGHLVRFTVSLGVATFPVHGATPDELTRCADLALYRAKREGRDRVVAHTPTAGSGF
ncbi:diguanylate cyclase [Azonexus sp.]|uniref:sensor domain-containing diguanylate cyclase n=1 Tax=Azonexus sp. TaxID=1872668 RepID=UPI0035B0CD13